MYRLLTKSNKSTGPDDIGNWILKNCSQPLADPLSILFNTTLDRRTLPKLWKLAHACPVYKKGDKSDKTNYRPISLQSNTSNILELIVHKRLHEYLTGNNLLMEQNSGFKRNDSTLNQLLEIVHQLYQNINDGKDTCLVFLDISKDFYKVWHEGLLFKIKRLGITGNLLDWLKYYITDRH